jgi:hypothetical protein
MMKNSIVVVLLLCSFIAFAQKMEKEMPKGYEQEKVGIAKGKIDDCESLLPPKLKIRKI